MSTRPGPGGRKLPPSLASVGFEFAGAIVGLTLIGLLLDRWLGTLPWLMLVGMLIGFTGGLYKLVMLTRSQT